MASGAAEGGQRPPEPKRQTPPHWARCAPAAAELWQQQGVESEVDLAFCYKNREDVIGCLAKAGIDDPDQLQDA
eukprot:11180316-Lingulodinium_polyedra.AAC.2